MSHIIFTLPKLSFLSHKPLRKRGTTKRKYVNKTPLFFDCKSTARYKDGDRLNDKFNIHSVLPRLKAEKFVPTLSFSSRVYSQKGYQTHDSAFDVCQINLNTLMSFSNAAPFFISTTSSEMNVWMDPIET